MALPGTLHLRGAERRRVVDAAGGAELADLVLRGGMVVNVFTERTERADVGVAAGRIAWVGTDPGKGAAREVDVSGFYLVPGFIEPHAHLDLMYRPEQALQLLAKYGTTLACGDSGFLMANFEDVSFLAIAEKLSHGPTRLLWNFRPWVDGIGAWELARFKQERITRLLDALPDVVATGELSCWPALVAGDERIGAVITRAANEGLRIDGHAPGASRKRLGQLLAAGVTACHEAINGDELLTRISLGYWTEIRHSTLRPDGPILARALARSGLPIDRVLLTTDGPEAETLVEGHLDQVIAMVAREGIDPIRAIKMATLNAATYLGIDAHVGSISPGRCADILAVRSVECPSPERMWIGGEEVSGEPAPVDWASMRHVPVCMAALEELDFEDFPAGTPGIELNGVVTLARDNPGNPLPSDWVRAYLVGRDGRHVTGFALHGIGTVDGFATSATGFGHILVMGVDAARMLNAYRRVVALGGGVVCAGGPELPLPIGGTLAGGTFGALLDRRRVIKQELRRRGLEMVSLDYVSLFLCLGVIPQIKLTDQGVVHVKRRQILVPAREVERTVV